jgi:hypothetical protein
MIKCPSCNHYGGHSDTCRLKRLSEERVALRRALIKCVLELRAMHSHYHPDCQGGCPFEDATNQAQAALGLTP